jgi:PAS domain S-box-containing protein
MKTRALLLLLLAPFASDAVDPIRLQLKWTHQFQFAGYYAAQAQGYYKDAGLDVEILPRQLGVNAAQQVLQGKAEFGVGTTDLLLLREQGQPVVALAVVFQHSPMALMTLKHDGIQSVHDLAGQKLMVETEATELYAYLEKEGVSAEKFTLIPHSLQTEDLLSGKVDAMSIYVTDELFELRTSGHDYLLYSPRSAGIDFYGDNLFTTEQQLKQHPERVRAFREASLKGWVYAMANPEEMVQLIYTQYSQQNSIEHLRFEADQMAPLLQTSLVEIGHMNPGRWRHIAETYASLGLMKPDFDLEGFLYDPNPPPPDLFWLSVFLGAAVLVVVGILAVALLIHRANVRLRREVKERRRAEERIAALLEESNQSQKAMQRIIEEETRSRVALHESEKRFKNIAESMSDWIWETDADGVYTFSSTKVESVLGYREEEVIGKTPFDFMPPAEAERVGALFGEIARDKRAFRDLENWSLTKDGRRICLLTSATPILGQDGELLGYRGVDTDITERKQAEDAVRASQQLLEGILNTIDVRVFWKDKNLVYLGCNQAFAQDAGYASPEDLIGKDDYEMAWREQAELYRASDQHVIEGGQPKLLLEEPQASPDGKTMTLLTNKIPLRENKGEICGVLGTYLDITERKSAELQLQEREAEFRSTIEDLQVGVVVHNADSRVVLSNPQAEHILGLTAEQIAGKNAVDPAWCFVHEDLSVMDVAEYPVSQVIASGERVSDVTLGVKRPDREKIIWVHINAMPVFTAEHKLHRVIVNFIDITDQKNASETLLAQNEELARFNKAAVGRELRMIELKKEVNALSCELQQPEPYPGR